MEYKNYLSHHGIQGQKWGIRNGPPYPIEDKVMAKGARLDSVSTDKNAKAQLKRIKRYENGSLYTFNPNNRIDSEIYKGAFSDYLMTIKNGNEWVQNEYARQFIKDSIKYGENVDRNKSFKNMQHKKSSVVENKYEVIKDLKMPNSKERYQEYYDLIKKNPKKYQSDLERISKVGIGMAPYIHNAATKTLENIKNGTFGDDKSIKDSYPVFQLDMEFVKDSVTTTYMENMKKKYDAMVDDHNVGVYNGAQDPIMVFEPSKVLKIVEASSVLTIGEILKNEGKTKKRTGSVIY